MVDKSGIVLHYLLNGNRILYNNQYIKLFEPGEEIRLIDGYGTSEHYWLGLSMMHTTEECFVGFGLDLVDFLDYCDSLTDDYIIQMTCTNVLKDIKDVSKIL